MNDKITIKRDNGELVTAIAPVIISASRATDIPAFYAKWLINRLKAGYCVWRNPYTLLPQYISFARTKVIVFWTKNPKPLIPYLHILDEMGIKYYFQFTLNDYEKEGFEPNVGSLEKRIETFKELSTLIGKEKVIWRFDPIILSDELTPRKILTKIFHIGNRIEGFTDKLVFSFVDVKVYKKVRANLVKETKCFTEQNVENAEPQGNQMEELADGLAKLREHWKSEGWNISLATCGEKIDLNKYGIEHNRCIDGELMKRIFADDKELVYYLNTGKLPERTNPILNQATILSPAQMKDKGQRLLCGCMVSKDIGTYSTCRHFCTYCYANANRETVLQNKDKHSDTAESII